MIALTWFVITMTAAGVYNGPIPETTQFNTLAECQSFGQRMTPRLQDWVRGMLRADWDHKVQVRFECRAGQRAL
ncbi:MAG: hypothetical protein HYZ11_17485 [Candidatus Tectomicrobia bacterium]|uniref:Uncharacterized protein n=1 Tax=Tectimicrobiota bacterium TaxID=2528274 RepID=A0A932I142_UNCTE|nr:hypothetical protein [Candidatus Tectomicrobia bacterium]